MSKLYDFLYRYQPYVLGIAIFTSLSGVSFSIHQGYTYLILRDYPILAVTLVGIGVLLGVIYVSVDKIKIQNLSNEITSHKNPSKTEVELHSLTERQREVYDLIINGKSNKEITSELYIAPSTLKTHINQIYKKLKVKNRKALKVSRSGSNPNHN